MICDSGCSKSRLAKAAGAEVAVERRTEKWHAAVARSTCASQNAPNTSGEEPFLKIRFGKMARHCGAKRICKSSLRHRFWSFRSGKMARHCGAKRLCKSKCEKTDGYGPLFELPMLKNDTRLWREAHLKMCKIPAFLNAFLPEDFQKCV